LFAFSIMTLYHTVMKPEDLQKAPKLFCENIKVGFTPEYFIMGLSSGNQATIYSRLIKEREKSGENCTPEEQAGYDAQECSKCRRMTIHQVLKYCVICGGK